MSLACSGIRPAPRNAIVVCTIRPLRSCRQLHPRALISPSTDLSSLSHPLLLLTCLVHFHPLIMFASNEGIIPVHSWRSAVDILFGQILCSIATRLFWNTSCTCHNLFVHLIFKFYIQLCFRIQALECSAFGNSPRLLSEGNN